MATNKCSAHEKVSNTFDQRSRDKQDQNLLEYIHYIARVTQV